MNDSFYKSATWEAAGYLFSWKSIWFLRSFRNSPLPFFKNKVFFKHSFSHFWRAQNLLLADFNIWNSCKNSFLKICLGFPLLFSRAHCPVTLLQCEFSRCPICTYSLRDSSAAANENAEISIPVCHSRNFNFFYWYYWSNMLKHITFIIYLVIHW